jgi:NAD(P)-dependent dehydrogenase (short-subunit alcohol dehydrogenase family)
MTDRKVVLVVGAGDATGGAIARRFAREGFTACVARRNADKLAPLVARIEAEGGRARAFGSDARREEQMVALVEAIEREEGAIEVAAFNIGGNVRFPIRETTARASTSRCGRCARSPVS